MKKKITLFLFVVLSFVAFAKDATFAGDNYDIQLSYNDTSCPGDAVFVRLKFVQDSKKSEKNRLDSSSAVLELYLGEKRLDKADFYFLPKDSNKNVRTMLAGIPLSSWWQKDNNFRLKVTYRIASEQAMSFELPFSLTDKTFVSETIPLDQQNTNIKTDTSTKRMQQIEKLNALLATVDSTAVYQTEAFAPPTAATRRTSYFADRRVYTYTNGKSSTGMHNGIDYGVPEGSTVSSCAAGKVVMAEFRISTGWSVVVEHLPGLYSLYYHMSELKVKEGDIVQQGDLLGLSGSTGLATGPHLHWEMRLGSVPVSPDFFTSNFTFAN